MSPYQGSDCSTSSASNGCAVTYCNEAPAESERVAAGALTIQGSETVVLDEENSFSASADRALFSSGDDVLLIWSRATRSRACVARCPRRRARRSPRLRPSRSRRCSS